MKRDIEWHKECLENQKKSLEKYKKDYLNALERFTRLENDITFLQYQITLAEKKGLNAFDHEKFGIKRQKGEIL